jgi:hypothetical protein
MPFTRVAHRAARAQTQEPSMPAKLLFSGRIAIALTMFLFFAVAVGIALTYPAQARFMPLVVGIPGIALTLFELFREIRRALTARNETNGGDSAIALPDDVSRLIGQTTVGVEGEAPKMTPAEAQKRELILLAYFTLLIAGLLFLGFWITVPTFVFVFLREREKAGWLTALVGAAATLAVLYFVFDRTLGIDLHPGFLTEMAWEKLFPTE